MKKILLINFLILLFIFIFIDFFSFFANSQIHKNYKNIKELLTEYKNYYTIKNDNNYLIKKYILGETETYKYKGILNSNSNKKPILLFGCSFVYGHKIPENKNMSSVLAEYIDNPIINRAFNGNSTQHMLYQLSQKEFYEIIKEPQFIIYTYIGDHKRRLKIPCVPSIHEYLDIFYKENNHKELEQIKNSKYLRKPFIIRLIEDSFYQYSRNSSSKYKIKDINFLKQHILASNKIIKNKWENSKFILFVYLESDYNDIKSIEKDLKENGITVIYRKNIAPFYDFDINFALSKNDEHPNKNAWEYIIPKLIKEIDIK